MITKNETRNLYYIDRDTNLDQLIEKIVKTKRAELTVFLRRQKERLEDKPAGEYLTIDDTTKLKEGELERMQRFFRGAVIPYYARQKYNIWSEAIEPDDLFKAANEIKRAVGFMKYDYTGHITDEVNSMANFDRAKDLNEFLNMVQVVCFDDDDFIFPDSEYFRKLEKQKGRHAAQRQVYLELYEKVKNKHYKRDITD